MIGGPPLRRRAALPLAVLGTLGLAGGLWAVPRLTTFSERPAPDRASVERFLGHPLPADASGFASRAEKGIDLRIQVAVEAPAEQARAFARDLLGNDLALGFDPGVAETGPAPSGWPSVAPADHSGGQRTEAGRAYRVLAVPASSGRTRLFIVGFTLL